MGPVAFPFFAELGHSCELETGARFQQLHFVFCEATNRRGVTFDVSFVRYISRSFSNISTSNRSNIKLQTN